MTALRSARPGHAKSLLRVEFVKGKFACSGDTVALVEGKLTMLGRTQPVTLKPNQFHCFESPMLEREVCGGDFETTIGRTTVDVNQGVDRVFLKSVRLVMQVEAVKQ